MLGVIVTEVRELGVALNVTPDVIVSILSPAELRRVI